MELNWKWWKNVTLNLAASCHFESNVNHIILEFSAYLLCLLYIWMSRCLIGMGQSHLTWPLARGHMGGWAVFTGAISRDGRLRSDKLLKSKQSAWRTTVGRCIFGGMLCGYMGFFFPCNRSHDLHILRQMPVSCVICVNRTVTLENWFAWYNEGHILDDLFHFNFSISKHCVHKRDANHIQISWFNTWGYGV